MASFKIEIDDFDLDKRKAASTDLSMLSNVVDDDAIKNTVCDKIYTAYQYF